MMGRKICFYGEMWLIIPKLFLLTLLIWSTDSTILIFGILSINCTVVLNWAFVVILQCYRKGKSKQKDIPFDDLHVSVFRLFYGIQAKS